MTGNGTSAAATITQPSNIADGYTYLSQSAVVKGQLHIFGGSSSPKRVCFVVKSRFQSY